MRIVNLFVICALVISAAYVYRIKMESTVRTETVVKLRNDIRQQRDAIANLKAEWAKLPMEYQEAFQAAAYESNVTMMAEYDHKNPIALSKLLQSGVKLQSFSDEILGAAYKASQQVYADESAKNPAFKKIYTEWEKYRKTQNAWFSVAEMRMDRFLQSHK